MLDFLISHWILTALFVAALVWMLCEEAQVQAGGHGVRQSPQQVVELMNREDAVVIDVRDPAAFGEGHILGSLNIVLSQIDQSLTKLGKYKNSPVVLVCGAGPQSLLAQKKLKKQDFQKLFILHGGLNAWKQASLPLTKNKIKTKIKQK